MTLFALDLTLSLSLPRGSSIAKIIGRNVQASNRFDPIVSMWVYEEMIDGRKLTDIINTDHENVKYLPGHKLPKNVVRLIHRIIIQLKILGAAALSHVLPVAFLMLLFVVNASLDRHSRHRRSRKGSQDPRLCDPAPVHRQTLRSDEAPDRGGNHWDIAHQSQILSSEVCLFFLGCSITRTNILILCVSRVSTRAQRD